MRLGLGLRLVEGRGEGLGRTWELGLPEGVGTGWTRCELHRSGRNSTFTLDMSFTRHTQAAPVGCFTEKGLTLPRKARTHSYSPTYTLTHIHRPPAQTPSHFTLTLHTHVLIYTHSCTPHLLTHIHTHIHPMFMFTTLSPYVPHTFIPSQTYPHTPSCSHTHTFTHTDSNLYTHTHHSLSHLHSLTHPQSHSYSLLAHPYRQYLSPGSVE